MRYFHLSKSFFLVLIFLCLVSTGLSQTNLGEKGLIAKFETPDYIEKIAFSPDGKLVAAGFGFYPKRGVTIWDLATQKLVVTLIEKDSKDGGIKAMSFSPDGKLLAAANDKGEALIWKVGEWRKFKKVDHGSGDINDLAFSPDGSTLAMACEKDVVIYDFNRDTLEVIASAKKDEREFDGVSFTPDAKFVAFSGSEGTRIWDIEEKRITKDWNNPDFKFFARLFPDGRHFISGGAAIVAGGAVEIRSFPDGRKVKELTEFRDGIFKLAISPSSKYFALAGGTYGSGGGSLSLWNFDDLEEIGFASIGQYPIKDIAFSPDGRILAVAGDDGYVFLYDANQFKGSKIKKMDFSLCGEIIREGNKTFIASMAKVPGIMSDKFGYAWKLRIANGDLLKEAVGSPVVVSDWEIVSSAADDKARINEFKYLLPKQETKSDYLVFGAAQNPGWNEGNIIKIFAEGSFIASNNSGKCLSYGNLSQLKTDYQSVKKRLLDREFLSIPKEPLTLGADHYRTQFIQMKVNGVSEIRSDADYFELLVKEKGQTKKREAFDKIYEKEESFIKSLLNAGFSVTSEYSH